MAYPFVTAFIVFPTASSSSVTVLVDSGRSLITATPPALSVIGPKASSEIMIPAMESMLMTAIAIP